MNSDDRRQVVAVAVSGGMDSLAALAGYREQNLPVFALYGIFAQYLDYTKKPGPVLPGRALPLPGDRALPPMVRLLEPAGLNDPAIKRLAETCKTMGTELFIADCSQVFLKKVISNFVTAYSEGRTPNPCAVCNAEIKFGLLMELAKTLGATHLATGHYARLAHSPKDLLPLEVPGEDYPALLQGADPIKDQSYFLSMVPLQALQSALFPLGEKLKTQVARDLGERNLEAPCPVESQEICFIPDNEYREFLPMMAENLGIALPGNGPVLLPDLRPIGTHKGLWQYTEGQRKGLGIAWSEPLHVIEKDAATNSLIVGPKRDMHAWGCVCREVNILLEPSKWPEEVFVKTRYRQKAVPASARLEQNPAKSSWSNLHITFAQIEQAIAPGQIAAVYIPVPDALEADGRPVLRLVAGGEITEVLRS